MIPEKRRRTNEKRLCLVAVWGHLRSNTVMESRRGVAAPRHVRFLSGPRLAGTPSRGSQPRWGTRWGVSTGSWPSFCWVVVSVAKPVYARSEEHTSELQSLMRISYAVFCLKKTKNEHY